MHVPTCRTCGWGLQARRGLGVALTVVLGVVAAVVLGPRLEGFDPWVRRLIVAGALLVALAPLLAWELLHPPKFTITAWRDTVDYEFGDDATAYEFAQMNSVPWDESLGFPP